MMKYALVDGQRREAEPRISGVCPVCGFTVGARCGEIRIWHWSHRSRRNCDHWWENETAWHRNWKAEFPNEWQEVVFRAEDGEKHIADVMTEHGLVIEFQHSFLHPEERRAREAFYGRMYWVVDGLRRKRDKSQFLNAVMSHQLFDLRGSTKLLSPADNGALLRDWADSRAPVFLDFGLPDLYRLGPIAANGQVLVTLVNRSRFIEDIRNDVVERKPVNAGSTKTPAIISKQSAPLPPLRLTKHERLAARKSGIRVQRRM